MRICFLSSGCFGFVIAVAMTGLAPAEQIGTKKELEDVYREHKGNVKEFMSGAKPVADRKSAEMAAQAAVRFHLLRITHESSYEGTQLSIIHKEFDAWIGTGLTKDAAHQTVAANKQFAAILGPKMVETMKELLERQDSKKDAKVIVNAAIMLPTMARLKSDDVEKYLTELLNDEKAHEVVRLYAAKALREYMPIVQHSNIELKLGDKEQDAKRDLDAKLVDALTRFIERPVKTTGMSLGEYEAIRFMRREAIASLAKAGTPAVLATKEKQGGKEVAIMGPVAPVLAKVLLKGQMNPPPTLAEKVEAAYGLLMMQHANVPDYNPDVATYLIGQTLVEFVNEYKKDVPNLGKKQSLLPWKDDAKRLKAGLKNHAENANTKEARELRASAEPVLDGIAAYKDEGRLELPNLMPKTNKMFKTLPTQEIPLDGK